MRNHEEVDRRRSLVLAEDVRKGMEKREEEERSVIKKEKDIN